MKSRKNNAVPEIPNKKAVASWLVSHTMLSFRQIADFCSIHSSEIDIISSKDLINGVMPFDPRGTYVSSDAIAASEGDEALPLEFLPEFLQVSAISKSQKTKPYSSKAQKRDRLDSVLWMVSFYPSVPDSVVAKLLRSTKSTVQKIRDNSYEQIGSLEAKSPVAIGLCSQNDLEKVLSKYDNQ